MRAAWALDHHVSVDLDLPDGPGRIAVISDTHSEPHPAALELVRAAAPHAVLHAGDIGALTVLDTFAAAAPVIAVRGNIDGRRNDLPDAITLHVRRDGAEVSRWLLVHAGVQGTRLLAPVRQLAQREGADLVICGHSHLPLVTRDGRLAVFNPGSIGPRRFHLPIVFGVITVAPTGVRFAYVDCTTGGPWVPTAAHA